MNKTNRPAPEQRATRPRRPFVGDTRDAFEVQGKDPNFRYRIVNDERGRVQRMLEAGYVVDDDTNINLIAGNSGTEPGSAHTLTVDRKHGTKGILMKIPREWAEEDDKLRADRIARSEEAIFKKERETDGRYGTLEKE